MLYLAVFPSREVIVGEHLSGKKFLFFLREALKLVS